MISVHASLSVLNTKMAKSIKQYTIFVSLFSLTGRNFFTRCRLQNQMKSKVNRVKIECDY